MIKYLKNHSRNAVNSHFRSKDVYFGPKKSQSFDMEDEEQKELYFYWINTFGFIQDITVKIAERK